MTALENKRIANRDPIGRKLIINVIGQDILTYGNAVYIKCGASYDTTTYSELY